MPKYKTIRFARGPFINPQCSKPKKICLDNFNIELNQMLNNRFDGYEIVSIINMELRQLNNGSMRYEAFILLKHPSL